MLFFYFTVVLCIGSAFGDDWDIPYRDEEDILYHFIRDRCNSLGGADGYSDLKDIAFDAIECMQNKTNTPIDSMRSICVGHEKSCEAPFVEKASTCFKEEEQYIPLAFTNVVENQLDILCSNNLINMEILLNDDTNKCMFSLASDSTYSKCFDDLVEKVATRSSGVLAREYFCSAIQVYTTCAKVSFENVCSEQKDTQQLFEAMLDGIFANLCTATNQL